MKFKGYIGIIISALTFFVVSQQQITVPNQEIVLQFSETNVSSSQTKEAIAAIKIQLKNIGVENTQLIEKNGTLKITYYSDITADTVKEILLKQHLVDVVNQDKTSDLPIDDNYNLDVFEINKSTEPGVGFDGKHSVEVKQEYTRSSQITVSFSAITENNYQINQLYYIAQKVNTTISIGVDKGTYNIPEVRAGPTA
ncbi:hypothetical protein [Olleya sp. R77988]|uniref:hypothetical protein n=1 Tax=Olleya sp. R77988 TaxID=3093875 RepID=UPI0037C96BC3